MYSLHKETWIFSYHSFLFLSNVEISTGKWPWKMLSASQFYLRLKPLSFSKNTNYLFEKKKKKNIWKCMIHKNLKTYIIFWIFFLNNLKNITKINYLLKQVINSSVWHLTNSLCIHLTANNLFNSKYSKTSLWKEEVSWNICHKYVKLGDISCFTKIKSPKKLNKELIS